MPRHPNHLMKITQIIINNTESNFFNKDPIAIVTRLFSDE
jgi:hypothetical protein